MREQTPFHHCDRCGIRVGVYEPARIELSDGTLVSGSVLAVDGTRRATIVRVWHRACAGDDAEPLAP
jgi:hypothetical protein